jgi:hypothetical protein
VNDPALRVSDEEREAAAVEIREHFAQGRLDTDELSDRLERAYAARTREDLLAVRADLPALPPTVASRKAEVAAQRAELTRHLAQRTGAAMVPFLVATFVWLVSGASGGFWPVWLLLFPAILLLRTGWRLFGPAPDIETARRELTEPREHRRRERERHRRHRRR